jgi:hypothetical protein
MPTEDIVAMLLAEREKIDRAIEALQGPRRRGRPPKNPLAALNDPAASRPSKRKGFSAAQRKAASARMKAYWAKRKKQ